MGPEFDNPVDQEMFFRSNDWFTFDELEQWLDSFGIPYPHPKCEIPDTPAWFKTGVASSGKSSNRPIDVDAHDALPNLP